MLTPIKIRSSTLLEMIVALTIMLIILSITFGIFMNIYKSSLTLPKLKSVLTIKKALLVTTLDKSFVNVISSDGELALNKRIKDYTSPKLILLNIAIKDSLKGIDYQMSTLCVKER